jgi:hypothetical protein
MKRPIRNFLPVALIVLTAATAPAQLTSSQPVGQVIKNFTMPQTDASGNITSVTSGDEARVISQNRTQIFNMKIDLYEGNDVTTVILSPKCDLWKSINKLRTRDGVIIKRPNMEITAKTLDWECNERRGTLRQDVRVVLQNFDLSKPVAGTRPAKPAAPADPASPSTPPAAAGASADSVPPSSNPKSDNPTEKP